MNKKIKLCFLGGGRNVSASDLLRAEKVYPLEIFQEGT